MTLKEYELFHGAVLAKLVRRDKPITLRLIETNTSESWSVYKVNDIDVFLKHSANPRELKKGGRSWTFIFGEKQLAQISENTHIALICGSSDTKDKNMGICFLKSQTATSLLSGNAKSITVHLEPGQRFRVSSSAVDEKVLIAQNAIEKYEIPS